MCWKSKCIRFTHPIECMRRDGAVRARAPFLTHLPFLSHVPSLSLSASRARRRNRQTYGFLLRVINFYYLSFININISFMADGSHSLTQSHHSPRPKYDPKFLCQTIFHNLMAHIKCIYFRRRSFVFFGVTESRVTCSGYVSVIHVHTHARLKTKPNKKKTRAKCVQF